MSDDATPAERETTDADTAIFEWKGEQFHVPATTEEWDVDVLEAFEQGKSATAAQAILGRKQWRHYKTTFTPKVPELNEFVRALAGFYGFGDPGE